MQHYSSEMFASLNTKKELHKNEFNTHLREVEGLLNDNNVNTELTNHVKTA